MTEYANEKINDLSLPEQQSAEYLWSPVSPSSKSKGSEQICTLQPFQNERVVINEGNLA